MKLFDLMYAGRSLGFTASAIGSTTLAAIFYQTSLGDFVYRTDSSGNISLDNQGPTGELYDGLLYSGRGIELGATNDVDIPIHYTLGADEFLSMTSNVFTTTPNGTGYDLSSLAGVNINTGSIRFIIGGIESVSRKVLLTFDVTITSGELGFDKYFDGSTYIDTYPVSLLVDGENIIEAGTRAGDDHAFLETYSSTDTTLAGAITLNIDNIVLQQITNPNSFLTYYDFTDGLVTLGNSVDGGSSEELNPTPNFGAFSAGDAGTVFSASNEVATITNGDATAAYINHNFTPTIGKTYKITGELISSSVVDAGRILFGGMDNTTIAIGNIDLIYTAISTVPLTLSNETGTLGATLTWGKFSITEILPISTKYTINTKTINNVLTHTTNWSALDWSKVNNNPNLVGKLALETLGATKTIAELDMELDQGASADSYYMCSEVESGYIVDTRKPSTEEAFVPTLTGQWVDNLDGSYTCTNSIADSDLSQNAALIPSGIAGVSYEVVNITGSLVNYPYAGNPAGFGVSTVGKHFLVNGTPNNTFRVIRAVAGTTVTIKNIVFYSNINALPIANYASTVRTNADLQQKGIQTTAFVTDGAGVPTAYSSNLLQFNGDGRYVDTSIVPPDSSAWEIDIVLNIEENGTIEANGIFPATVAGRLFIGKDGPNRVYAHVGDKIVTESTVTAGIRYATLYYDGNGNGGLLVDNSALYTFTLSSYTYDATQSFFIGSVSTVKTPVSSFIPRNPIGTFRYTNKARTADERTADYNSTKTIYPTLP